MKKKFTYRKINSCKIYSITEIRNLINVHRRSVQNWVRGGLQIKNPGGKPMLIDGADLKKFLKDRIAKQKIKLKYDEFFCMKCKKGMKAKDGTVQFVKKNKFTGQENRQWRLLGICERCSGKLSRLSSTNDLKRLGLYNSAVRD
ncbi:MAG: hypothetical protein IIC75_07750 [Bacteroidetes bacterium]|nr:hypothetical protein [Bacteroidota bacterium]